MVRAEYWCPYGSSISMYIFFSKSLFLLLTAVLKKRRGLKDMPSLLTCTKSMEVSESRMERVKSTRNRKHGV